MIARAARTVEAQVGPVGITANQTAHQILLAIMTGAFTLAGWHFSRNPTSSSSENKVFKAEHSEPWKTGGNAAYQYHPHGDPSKGRKDAPSALNEVIIPNVNLPKVSQSYSVA